MEIISRVEAELTGIPRYYTGKPCRRGHLAPRYVIGGNCYDCTKHIKREYNRKRRAEEAPARIAIRAEWDKSAPQRDAAKRLKAKQTNALRYTLRRDDPEEYARHLAKRKAWRSSDQAKRAARDYNLRQNQGVTLREVETALYAQGYKCGLCEKDISGLKWGKKIVDHDHRRKVFRAVLCTSCNTGLGKFKDSPALLRKAAEYIEKHLN